MMMMYEEYDIFFVLYVLASSWYEKTCDIKLSRH